MKNLTKVLAVAVVATMALSSVSVFAAESEENMTKSERPAFSMKAKDNGAPMAKQEKKEKPSKVAMTEEEYAHRVLDYFGILNLFDYACGATMDEKTRATKDQVMTYALELSGTKPSEAIMIGDRKFDINSASKFGLDSVGVTFGYGSKKELEEAGATFVVDSANQIKTILLGE